MERENGATPHDGGERLGIVGVEFADGAALGVSGLWRVRVSVW
jgi:hypothetical protein